MSKIICTRCKLPKNKSEFGKKTSKRLQSYCKICLYEYQTKRWIDRKIWAVTYKGNNCSRCHKEFPYYVFDFHHLNPSDKLYDWNKMRLISKEKLIKELDKCILVCANCHRIIEHEVHLSN